ncbi:MAG: glycosyl transferase family 1, partial [Niveispirillum sp.]|nr:glycosyl transferase family 1 [Niveispirillum sp.]
SWLDRRPVPATQKLAPPTGYAHRRLRIGYMSSDFCRHAMTFLIAELLERHDRERFEIYGYCSSPDDGSDMRARVLAALDHCRFVRDKDHEAVARQIKADEIDILIDLNGITVGERLDVLRWKPAPVQMTYLGFIGPIPIPELDYILTDEYAIPPSVADQYWPRPLYLPGVYQANDGRPVAQALINRADEGLPQDRFVYCCFCGSYKISEAMFALWMRILARTGDSVLWLLEDNRWVVDNLRAQAARHGVDPDRLIFSPRAAPDRYRARMALADLFLDTTPYNAGTVASDALRAGLPILTLSRETFASRMAGALLRAMDVPELITTSDDDYVDRAVALHDTPDLYRAIRDRTTPQRWQATLGDTQTFTRGFEATLERVAIQAG